MDISKEKLEAFNAAVLESGSHKDYEAGVCAMELVSYIANEPFSDKPKCACPALTQYIITLNDNFTASERQFLKPYLLKLLGTRDGKEVARAHIMARAAVTVFAPFALAAAGLQKEAQALRDLTLGDWEGMRSAAKSAAESASGSAARSAAWAAESAAESASGSAAWAAWSASAAWSAAWSAGSVVNRQQIVEAALKTLLEAIDV